MERLARLEEQRSNDRAMLDKMAENLEKLTEAVTAIRSFRDEQVTMNKWIETIDHEMHDVKINQARFMKDDFHPLKDKVTTLEHYIKTRFWLAATLVTSIIALIELAFRLGWV